MKNTVIVVLLLLMAVVTGCDKKSKSTKWQDTTTTGLVPVAIDENYRPIMATEIDVFETTFPQAGILPIYTNENDALKMLFDDSVRLAIVSRKLSKAEKIAYEQKKRYPREIEIAKDALALIINRGNMDSLISVQNLKDILTGKITKWSELYPSTHLKGEINIVFDNTQSGNVRYIIDSICKGDALSSNVYAKSTNEEVIEYVEKSPHAIGIIGVNWVGRESDTIRLSFNERVRVMAVSRFENANEDNSYQPFQAYIATKDYPLIRELYAVMNDPKNGLSTGFASFLSNQKGQRIILKSGLVPATQQIRLVHITKE